MKHEHRIVNGLIVKYLENWNGLKKESIRAFLNDNKVSGSLLLAIQEVAFSYADELHKQQNEPEYFDDYCESVSKIPIKGIHY